MPAVAHISQCHARFNDCFDIYIDDLHIQSLQHTVILGANGSGKSAVASLIAGQGQIVSGARQCAARIAWVSVEYQRQLIEAERQKDCADILDVLPEPTRVSEVLFEGLSLDPRYLKGLCLQHQAEAKASPQTAEPAQVDSALLDKMLDDFALRPLLNRPFRALSTGETRKLLICRGVIQAPELLVLDEPFAGLDTRASEGLQQVLAMLSRRTTLVFVLNRLAQVPAFCQQVLLTQQGRVSWQSGSIDSLADTLDDVAKWLHMQQPSIGLPPRDADSQQPPELDPAKPLVKFTDVAVRYPEQTVFAGVNWQLDAGQHWHIVGPNGSGKTCFLNLITGDHPQCYVNNIHVFGFKRGSGESIWQIKQYIGFMSNGLHLDYRVNCSALQVVLSGFYDSIGMYQQPSPQQLAIAQQWLQVLALESQSSTGFNQLSFGDQRMLLIARAMVKHPALLILDEPCNGLDDINRLKVLALIERLAKQGTTSILYVNHHSEDKVPSITRQLSMLDYKDQS